MANAIEEALNRASVEQKARNEQVIEEARRNIKLVSMQQMDDISSSSADSIARNAQIIEEAKRNIPFETMQHVDSIDSIGPPPATPTMIESNPNVIHINPSFQENIESIQQSGGNNYLQDNAIDRAAARESQDRQNMQYVQEQQQAMSR